jgi:formylglycine-generating enzyme required for sulfatase activity
VYIPAGEFIMGSGNGDSDEQPVRRVYLDAYWMYETEVTNAQYAEFVGGNTTLVEHPVKNVTWHDAVAYCAWAGGRLPTEAEWEKAARGTDGRTYPWGDSWNASNANSSHAADGYDQTAPVGSFPGGASPYGLLDMAGNVWEWVGDWYASGYYANAPDNNPSGPNSGEYRVLRGGSWFNIGHTNLRAANRRASSSSAGDYFGFRCASSLGS